MESLTETASEVRIEKINLASIIPNLQNKNIELNMARLDENHALASGNKIYKLNPVIEHAKENNIKQIISFGGAFSNHIHALAHLAKQHEIESIAIIRGEEWYAQNPTLSDVQEAGMKLEFVSRAEYKKRNDEPYLIALQSRYPKALIIPEGGSSPLPVEQGQRQQD